MNRPYAGGFITEHHGRPQRGIHALQIELNRGLYLDERRFNATSGFAALKADLEQIFQHLILSANQLFACRAAAE